MNQQLAFLVHYYAKEAALDGFKGDGHLAGVMCTQTKQKKNVRKEKKKHIGSLSFFKLRIEPDRNRLV